MKNICVKDMMESKRHPNGWVGPSYPLDPPVPALLHMRHPWAVRDIRRISHQHILSCGDDCASTLSSVECKRHTYIIYIHFKAKPDNPQQSGGTHLVSSSKD